MYITDGPGETVKIKAAAMNPSSTEGEGIYSAALLSITAESLDASSIALLDA